MKKLLFCMLASFGLGSSALDRPESPVPLLPDGSRPCDAAIADYREIRRMLASVDAARARNEQQEQALRDQREAGSRAAAQFHAAHQAGIAEMQRQHDQTMQGLGAQMAQETAQRVQPAQQAQAQLPPRLRRVDQEVDEHMAAFHATADQLGQRMENYQPTFDEDEIRRRQREADGALAPLTIRNHPLQQALRQQGNVPPVDLGPVMRDPIGFAESGLSRREFLASRNQQARQRRQRDPQQGNRGNVPTNDQASTPDSAPVPEKKFYQNPIFIAVSATLGIAVTVLVVDWILHRENSIVGKLISGDKKATAKTTMNSKKEVCA